ncbi:MAG TPA: hypothetical protein VFC19_54435 [Candidatus Limnocylindrales bacterium]|nr:hypothetical protein [Candidatus Limnocylindrales bacterium]
MRVLIAAWRETTPGVRALCLALWTTGVLAVALGVWGDATGWWDDKGFLANLASSLAGALFGVPFALVVIQHITARQADERERRDVTHKAAQLARELAADARELVRVEAYPQAIANLRMALRRAVGALEQLASGQDTDPDAVNQAYVLWHEMVNTRTTTELLLDRIWTNWRSLKEDTRPRLLRIGVPWIDRELEELLDEALAATRSAGADLYWMDELRQEAGELDRQRLGRDARAHLRRLDLADEHLRLAERVSRYADEIWRHLNR